MGVAKNRVLLDMMSKFWRKQNQVFKDVHIASNACIHVKINLFKSKQIASPLDFIKQKYTLENSTEQKNMTFVLPLIDIKFLLVNKTRCL